MSLLFYSATLCVCLPAWFLCVCVCVCVCMCVCASVVCVCVCASLLSLQSCAISSKAAKFTQKFRVLTLSPVQQPLAAALSVSKGNIWNSNEVPASPSMSAAGRSCCSEVLGETGEQLMRGKQVQKLFRQLFFSICESEVRGGEKQRAIRLEIRCDGEMEE